MDIYAETTIHRQITTNPKIIQHFFFSLVVLSVFLMLMFSLWLFVLVLITLYMFIWTLKNLDLEYDYVLTNEDFDIDRVIGGKSRKHMITIKLGQVALIAPYGSDALRRYGNIILKDYSCGRLDNPPYIFICNVNGTNCRIAVQLNEEMLTLIQKQIPQKVVLE